MRCYQIFNLRCHYDENFSHHVSQAASFEPSTLLYLGGTVGIN